MSDLQVWVEVLKLSSYVALVAVGWYIIEVGKKWIWGKLVK